MLIKGFLNWFIGIIDYDRWFLSCFFYLSIVGERKFVVYLVCGYYCYWMSFVKLCLVIIDLCWFLVVLDGWLLYLSFLKNVVRSNIGF